MRVDETGTQREIPVQEEKKGDDISSHLAELSPSKRALFDALLRERQVSEAPAPAVAPPLQPDLEQRYSPFPLTDMQQAYWVGRSGALRLGMATHMYEEIESRDLDLDRLGRAWRQLVRRHDMLRAIVLPDGRQQILENVPEYTIKVTDVRGFSPEEIAGHLEETRDRMSHQVLPSDRWPLFELRATRLGDRHYRVHISIDGLLLDGWSYQILFREWIERYQEPGKPLVPFEISFRDYVLAELASRDSGQYARALAYWQARLPDLPQAPDLPLLRQDMPAQPHFSRRKDSLDVDTWARLKARGTKAGLSPSSIVLAAYAEVLATWSKTPHFTLNVPRFNRLPLHPDVNELIGEFASFTLLEVDSRSPDSFEIRARRLQEQLWRDLDHHQVSGVQILRELNRVQRPTAEALMPVVFTTMPHSVDANRPAVALALADQAVFGVTQTSQIWLDCQSGEDAGMLVFNWDSVDELFPLGLLDDMFGAFCGFLRRLADEPQSWQQTPCQLIPEAQLRQRTRTNATEAPIPSVLLHELFAEQSRLRPQHPAIITAGTVLTYRELETRAAHLGVRLRSMGVRPNTLVAIVMEKGPEQVIAALAILIAGGAYLPIDPTLPEERLHHLLQHGAVDVALTQSRVADQVTWPPNVERICVDQEHLPESKPEPLQTLQGADDLAYVIYTSGSTGVPKGVMITQQGVTNAVVETNRHFNIGPSDRVFALTALHHDMSVYDIFGMLAAGGTLVMPAAVSTRDPATWAKLMERDQVSIWNSVPALLEMLVEYASAQLGSLPASLRLAFVGGDWIPLALPARVRALAENAQVISVGGPTETTLWNIWYPVDQIDPAWQSIPYGSPIANNKYYVLNQLGEHCPTWVPGALCCSGVGVAKGYWRDEEKTAASFQTHPRLGERLYRTGDMGRYLPDGTIEFLGREDFQIKIQGMRIELGEIESALLQHRMVRAAVVTVTGESSTARQLAAHIVLDQPAPAPAAGLDDFVDRGDAQQLEDVLLDPAARVEFKLRRHGQRRFASGQRSVELIKPAVDESLLAAYAKRRSYRQYTSEPIPFRAFSEFLSSLWSIDFEGVPVPKYRYASSGGLYPVQTYLYIRSEAIEGLPAGAYYYSSQDHRLITLNEGLELDRAIHIAANQPIFDDSGFSIFLIADMDAITPMYGKLSKEFCFLEAGYIAQMLMQAAPSQQIGLCPIGTVRSDQFRDAFQLEPRHVLLHTLVGGSIAADQVEPAAYIDEISSLSSAGSASRTAETQHALIAGVQAFLKQKLPAHMVPVSFTVWDSFPLTPNGKIDRKALAAKNRPVAPASSSYVPPRTALESQMVEIWRSVLHSDRVGVDDNFFELGGNSLQLVQIHSVLENTLNRKITVVDLFQYPTIRALAGMLSGEANGDESFDESYSRAEMRAKSRNPGSEPVL